MDKHIHKWRTRYVTIESVDCASGMVCDCGAKLRQDEVEDMINGQPETSAENLEVAPLEHPHGDEPSALQLKSM